MADRTASGRKRGAGGAQDGKFVGICRDGAGIFIRTSLLVEHNFCRYHRVFSEKRPKKRMGLAAFAVLYSKSDRSHVVL